MLQTISPEYPDLYALANYSIARISAIQGNINEAKRLGEENVKALETMQHRKAKEARDWLNSIK